MDGLIGLNWNRRCHGSGSCHPYTRLYVSAQATKCIKKQKDPFS
jgi:hypothetical protein